MRTELYNALPECAKAIRQQVFMEEQGFCDEFDNTDEKAFHLVLFDESGEPAGTCRVFAGEEADTYILGRLAVLKEYRGRKAGAKLVREAEKFAAAKGGKKMILHAQCRIRSFYEKLGFSAYGEIDDDEGCPHVWMEKRL